MDANRVISTLGLDGSNLEASVHRLLNTPGGRTVALALKGDAALAFLDILQKVLVICS
jgi:hypothetical protein